MSFPFLHLHHFHAHPVSGTYFLKLCLYLSGSGRKIFRNSQLHGYFMILEICQKLEISQSPDLKVHQKAYFPASIFFFFFFLRVRIDPKFRYCLFSLILKRKDKMIHRHIYAFVYQHPSHQLIKILYMFQPGFSFGPSFHK